MLNDIFNENMSSNEARLKLFSIIQDKSEKEIEEIKQKYFEVIPKIIEKEIKLAEDGWSFS